MKIRIPIRVAEFATLTEPDIRKAQKSHLQGKETQQDKDVIDAILSAVATERLVVVENYKY